MSEFEALEISSNFRIEVFPTPKMDYPTRVKDKIEEIWDKEVALRGKHLFNGQILSATSLAEDVLRGHFVEYKVYLAQIRYPVLYQDLHIRPVCVSGMTCAEDKILMGQRSHTVTESRGLYEFVPSGGIDPDSLVEGQIDFRKQFLLELQEEAEISPNEVIEIQPLYMVYHAPTVHYELCAKLLVDPVVLQRKILSRVEYDRFEWLSPNEIRLLVEEQGQQIVPLSLHLLNAIF